MIDSSLLHAVKAQRARQLKQDIARMQQAQRYAMAKARDELPEMKYGMGPWSPAQMETQRLDRMTALERDRLYARRNQRRACRDSDQAEPGNTAAALPVTITMRGEHGGLQRHAARWLPSEHPDMHVIDRMGASGELDCRHYANAQALLHLWHKAGIYAALVSSYEPRIASTTGDEGRDDEATWHVAMRRLIPAHQHWLGVLVRGRHPGADLHHVRAALDLLDYLTAQHDGEMWRGE